jgi:hypothetical protein
MQVRHVPGDGESLAAASSLEGFDNPVPIRQSTRNGSHMARCSRSTMQHEDTWSGTSILAHKKHKQVHWPISGTSLDPDIDLYCRQTRTIRQLPKVID